MIDEDMAYEEARDRLHGVDCPDAREFTIPCPFCPGTANITYEGNRLYQLSCPRCRNGVYHHDNSWANAQWFFKHIKKED